MGAGILSCSIELHKRWKTVGLPRRCSWGWAQVSGRNLADLLKASVPRQVSSHGSTRSTESDVGKSGPWRLTGSVCPLVMQGFSNFFKGKFLKWLDPESQQMWVVFLWANFDFEINKMSPNILLRSVRDGQLELQAAVYDAQTRQVPREGPGKKLTGWWFQILFMFTPVWGRFPIWLYIVFFRWVETTHQLMMDMLEVALFLDVPIALVTCRWNFWAVPRSKKNFCWKSCQIGSNLPGICRMACSSQRNKVMTHEC